MKKIDPIDDNVDGDLSDAMRRLVKRRHTSSPQRYSSVHHSEPRLAVLYAHLVAVLRREQQVNVERHGGGGGGCGGGRRRVDSDVLDGDGLEIEGGFFGLDGEDDDEDDGEDEEGDEGEEEEEAAATALEGS